jgi:hypothetical protein
MQSIKMVPSGITIAKEQFSALAYADYIVLIGKNEIEKRRSKLIPSKRNVLQCINLD